MTDIVGNTREAFELAIELERYGYDFYTAFAESIDDDNGKALMTFLANAEKEHEEAFTKMRENAADIEISESIPSMDPGAVFPVDRVREVDAIEATTQAVDVEVKTAAFYQRCADSVDDVTIKDFFLRLVEEEQVHKTVLEENLRSLKSGGTWSGYLPILEG